MNKTRFWDSEVIYRIINSESMQLKDLAYLAGLRIENVLQYGELRGVDMRFQDLNGIDLSEIDLSESITDETTLVDDYRTFIGGTENIIEQYFSAISNAYDMPDWRPIWKRFRFMIGKPTKFMFFLGNSTDIMSFIRHTASNDQPIPIISVSSGYFARRVAFIECDADKSLDQSVMSFFESHYPSFLVEQDSSVASSTQLELPLHDGPLRIRRKPATPTKLNRVITSLRKSERISDICLIINEPLDPIKIRNLQKEITGFIRSRVRLRYLFLCNTDTLISSSWRRSLVKDQEITVINESDSLTLGLSGYLRSISTSMLGNVKFTAPFISQLFQTIPKWQDADGAVASAGVHAIQRARNIPISVGMADLRFAIAQQTDNF
jgi:hypothetical protein